MTDPKLKRPLGIFLGILIAAMGILSGISLAKSVVARFVFQPTPFQLTIPSPVVFVTLSYMPTVMYTPTNTPTSADTPTPTPTDTPSPTPHKPSNTPTSTPTIITTLMSTPPLTNTLTPIPTATPTLTPTPKPDAVVNAEALNLRSGPGTVYDVVGWLVQGDSLKITGRNLAGDWLKVICPDGREGWAARSLLQVNVDMADVPMALAPPTPTSVYTPIPTVTLTPMLLPPPILLEPENGASFIADIVPFQWQWDKPLAQDEYFALGVRKEGEQAPCHHKQQIHALKYFSYLDYCSEGKHYWVVALVRKLCEDCPAEEMWQDFSEPSAERWIYYTPGEEEKPPLPPPH